MLTTESITVGKRARKMGFFESSFWSSGYPIGLAIAIALLIITKTYKL
jgi:hypothetical protein